MISKSKNNLWKWTQSADYSCVHAGAIKPTVTTIFNDDDNYTISIITDTGVRFPSIPIRGNLIIGTNGEKVYSEKLVEKTIKLPLETWLDIKSFSSQINRKIEKTLQMPKESGGSVLFTLDYLVRCEYKKPCESITTYHSTLKLVPLFSNAKIVGRSNYSNYEKIVQCDVQVKIKGEIYTVTKNKEYTIDVWRNLVTLFSSNILAEISNGSLDSDAEWDKMGGYLIPFLIHVSSIEVLQTTGEIVKEKLFVKLLEVGFLTDGPSSLPHREPWVKFTIVISNKSGIVIAKRLHKTVSSKVWNKMISHEYIKSMDIEIKITGLKKKKRKIWSDSEGDFGLMTYIFDDNDFSVVTDNREEPFNQLRAKSAANPQIAKESQESRLGSTKTTTKSTNRKGRSKIKNNAKYNSSKHKHKNLKHNSGKNKKRSKKNSSPLGDALNDLKRARKAEENAKKNQGKRQQRAAKLEVERCQRIVDNLKKSNK